MSHDHAPADFGRAFAIGIALNITFVGIEAFYGWRAGSLALLADAGHNLGDVGGLALAWAGLAAGKLLANDRHTYGWRRASILASFINATLLLVLMGALALEAVQRLGHPSGVDEWPVLIVAGVGIFINGVTAWLFIAGSKGDLNIRGAFLHMAADALVSLGVVISAAVMLATGWLWMDPIASLLIVGVVVWGTGSLFRQSLHLLFDGVPEHIALPEVRQSLLALPGVVALHDLHAWAMSTSETALSVHLVLARKDPDSDDALLDLASDMLHERFEIAHATLQLEATPCASAASPDRV